MSTLELDVWDGDWGLPSVDAPCLQIMTYAKFCGAPVKLRKTNNPWRSPTGELPVLRHSKNRITGFQEMRQLLKDQNFNADFELDRTQLADLNAYMQMIRQKLSPALLFLWWVDLKMYEEQTRPWYAKHLPFLMNYIVPGQICRRVHRYLRDLYNIELADTNDIEQLQILITRNARECSTVLATRLGDDDYVFGKSPSSLDATIYAYLAPLLKAPFLNVALTNHVKACPNLVSFVNRITSRYYPHLSGAAGDNNKSSTVSDDPFDYPHKRRNQVLAGLFASFAMAAYAFMSGIVQVEFNNRLTDEVEEDLYGDDEYQEDED